MRLPVMTPEDVNIWINYIVATSGRSYQSILNSLEMIKNDNVGNQTRLQNLDLITERLRKLTFEKNINKRLDNQRKTIAVRDVFEKRTGQTGDPKSSAVGNILDYAGIPKPRGGKRRTLKKRKRTTKKRFS
jgi:hypothetical protein